MDEEAANCFQGVCMDYGHVKYTAITDNGYMKSQGC